MKKSAVFFVTVWMLALSISHAEEHGTYEQGVMEKAGNGFANVAGSVLEIPKSMINTTNESNLVYGVFGGLLKGTLNMMGRMGTGVVDIVTAPIPTQPIVHPIKVWDDFDADTQYGQTFRLPKDYQQQ